MYKCALNNGMMTKTECNFEIVVTEIQSMQID